MGGGVEGVVVRFMDSVRREVRILSVWAVGPMGGGDQGRVGSVVLSSWTICGT